jgi:DNA repair ATPase RecN
VGQERSNEIAAMLGGVSDSVASLQNAEEMLQEAIRWKRRNT